MAGKVVDKVQEAASRLVGSDQGNNTPGGNAGGSQSPPVTEQATEQVTSRLDMGKEYVVETITGVAQALRQTSQHLRDEGAQPTLAQYADRGAEQIETFTGYLRRRDTGQLVTDVEGFARRQPLAFAGGAFALGMLAVRFLRSRSEPRGQSTSSPSSASYGSSAYNTPPRAGSTGPGMTSRSASTQPGGYTAAAQEALNRATASRTTSPSRSGSASGAGVNPGTPAAPGPGYGTSVPQSEEPTPSPATTPVTSSTPAGAGSTTPTPAPGAQSGVSPSTSERTGADGRNQS
jgi:hypothetical protein